MRLTGDTPFCKFQRFQGAGSFGELTTAIPDIGTTSKQKQYWENLWPSIKDNMASDFTRDTSTVAFVLQVFDAPPSSPGSLQGKVWNSLYLTSSEKPDFCQIGCDIDPTLINDATSAFQEFMRTAKNGSGDGRVLNCRPAGWKG
jgi:hypothetical protein